MVAQGKEAEADALLRVISTNARWSDFWNVAGPLWADIAFQQGQYREGIRRWRHTCGPPGGDLLLFLFEKLVPDLGDWSLQVETPVPRKPGRVPESLVRVSVHAVLDQLLALDDYAGVERLMTLIEKEPEWRDRLPVDAYRSRVLERLAREETTERTLEWMRKHPGGDSAATGVIPEMEEWISYVESITNRIQSLRK